MTVIIGVAQSTVFSGVPCVVLTPPRTFDTVQAVRLSNTGSDPMILNNISDLYQGQEYLLPGQTMVYKSPNRTSTPYVLGKTANPATVLTSLLIEWSDDAETDFVGTYPSSFAVHAF